MIVTILAFVLVFGTIVFVHEFGHYTVAKRSGILVREFAIGMGLSFFLTASREQLIRCASYL